MERREFLMATALTSVGLGGGQISLHLAGTVATGPSVHHHERASTVVTRKILIAGGGFRTAFIRYMAELTGKARPKLCFLPTAWRDDENDTIAWFKNCAPLNVEASVQNSFIESLTQPKGWDEVFLSVDGIVVGGGNTLNQQAIWQAQGIDVVLRQAWEQGIVLGGASAGSLCWFEEGTTDSRPKALSIVKCLGLLKGSHSPHYDAEPGRRPLYQKLIASGAMQPGYACDNDAGIYFENDAVQRVVATRPEAKVYHVTRVGNQAVERVMEPEQID